MYVYIFLIYLNYIFINLVKLLENYTTKYHAIRSSLRLAKIEIYLTCIESNRYKKEIASQYIALMQL